MAEKDISPAKIDEVKNLVNRGKKEGELTYEEIMDALEDIDLDSEDIEKIYDIFSDMNIEIVNSKLEADEEDEDDENSGLDLAERVVAAMKAAQASGGDIRGKQSSALIVVGKDAPEQPWLDKKIDLRVEDHKTPVEELSRLLNSHRAYEYMEKGDVAMENEDPKAALEAYHTAEKLLPNNDEIKFWKAVALVNSDQVKVSIPIFERLFMNDKRWQRLLKRLPSSNLITIDKSALDYLLNL